MHTSWKKLITLILVTAVMSFSVSSQAANLYEVSDTLSNHNPNQAGVLHTIKFKPATSIAGPGDLKITFANGFNLSSVAASVDVGVSGGGVTWNGVLNGDLNVTTRVLTLGWTTGTLTAGSLVTVTVNFVKNPAVAANYNITIETGSDGFVTATDSRVIPVVITNAGVAVSANVPYPQTNPTITAITPVEPIVVSASGSQGISFTLTDVNNNNVDYTITAITDGTISLPTTGTVTGTTSGVVVTFTYFATAVTGAKTITITADDNEPVGGALPVTYDIQLFVI